MDSKDINERRRGDLDKFLTTTNTKAAVFRDIIIESGMIAMCWVCVVDRGGGPYQEQTHLPRTSTATPIYGSEGVGYRKQQPIAKYVSYDMTIHSRSTGCPWVPSVYHVGLHTMLLYNPNPRIVHAIPYHTLPRQC